MADLDRRLVRTADLAIWAVEGDRQLGPLPIWARTAFAPIEIPCGIVTAAVGAPYFLYLLYRTQSR